MIRILIALFALIPTLGWAQESLNANGTPMGTADWLSWGLSMVLVLVAIGVCAWLAKKTRFNAYGQGQQLKVVANLTLGTRERILVVQVGEQQYLLGVTNQRIELLDKLDEPLSSTTVGHSMGFAQQLNRVLKGYGRKS
ncbi:flagellar biosynthetic protein FliO [Celerinatantimonas sp. YJH-8]|uniref:flagellar biosynthetic protein FliO n=1 Tax=Celerinatantimonas sp. YJH-8 TaxID=3228714 RepID=UPI0038C7440D